MKHFFSVVCMILAFSAAQAADVNCSLYQVKDSWPEYSTYKATELPVGTTTELAEDKVAGCPKSVTLSQAATAQSFQKSSDNESGFIVAENNSQLSLSAIVGLKVVPAQTKNLKLTLTSVGDADESKNSFCRYDIRSSSLDGIGRGLMLCHLTE